MTNLENMIHEQFDLEIFDVNAWEQKNKYRIPILQEEELNNCNE